MQVKVLLFASLKDQVGERCISLELPNDATVKDLLRTLSQRYPSLSERWNVVQVAVNEEYATPVVLLHPNDEVALIPPVSGGADV